MGKLLPFTCRLATPDSDAQEEQGHERRYYADGAIDVCTRGPHLDDDRHVWRRIALKDRMDPVPATGEVPFLPKHCGQESIMMLDREGHFLRWGATCLAPVGHLGPCPEPRVASERLRRVGAESEWHLSEIAYNLMTHVEEKHMTTGAGEGFEGDAYRGTIGCDACWAWDRAYRALTGAARP